MRNYENIRWLQRQYDNATRLGVVILLLCFVQLTGLLCIVISGCFGR